MRVVTRLLLLPLGVWGARFPCGWGPVQHALEAKVSRERVGVELDNMLLGGHPQASLDMLVDLGLLQCFTSTAAPLVAPAPGTTLGTPLSIEAWAVLAVGATEAGGCRPSQQHLLFAHTLHTCTLSSSPCTASSPVVVHLAFAASVCAHASMPCPPCCGLASFLAALSPLLPPHPALVEQVVRVVPVPVPGLGPGPGRVPSPSRM